MADPTITSKANLNKLRGYVEHVRSNDKTKNDVIYAKANYQGDQGLLIRSVIDSVGGKKRQERALSMLYQALENSYSTDIAAHVFSNIDGLLEGKASLSTALIDKAKKAAEERQSELADLSNIGDNKIDIGDDDVDQYRVQNEQDIRLIKPKTEIDDNNPSGGLNEADIVVIKPNKDIGDDKPIVPLDYAKVTVVKPGKEPPAADLQNKNIVVDPNNEKKDWLSSSKQNLKTNAGIKSKNKIGNDNPTVQFKYKKITDVNSQNKNAASEPTKKKWWSVFSRSKKNQKKNAAIGQSSSSKLNENQQKLADIKNKTKEVEDTYKNLNDIKQKNLKKKNENKKKYLKNQLKYQKKLSKLKSGKTGRSSRAKHAKYVENIQKMRADLYIKKMENGGQENGKDIKSLDSLLNDAARGIYQPFMTNDERKQARQTIYKAFENYSATARLSAMDHHTQTQMIVKPALKAFLKDLNNKKKKV